MKKPFIQDYKQKSHPVTTQSDFYFGFE